MKYEFPELDNPKNVKFEDLIKICIQLFGKPRIRVIIFLRCHGCFWAGNPRINLQRKMQSRIKSRLSSRQ